jgi:hypothetical protein
VVGATPRPGRHTVYNFEVHVEHVYHVSPLGLLVHNKPPDPVGQGKPPGIPPPPTGKPAPGDGGDYVSLWRAPRRGQGQRHTANGFDPVDFPRGPDPTNPRHINDGNAYFVKDNQQVAIDDYAGRAGYETGLIEVRIPRGDYNQYFSRYEQTLARGDGNATEVPIPREQLSRLNQYPRVYHPLQE